MFQMNDFNGRTAQFWSKLAKETLQFTRIVYIFKNIVTDQLFYLFLR